MSIMQKARHLNRCLLAGTICGIAFGLTGCASFQPVNGNNADMKPVQMNQVFNRRTVFSDNETGTLKKAVTSPQGLGEHLSKGQSRNNLDVIFNAGQTQFNLNSDQGRSQSFRLPITYQTNQKSHLLTLSNAKASLRYQLIADRTTFVLKPVAIAHGHGSFSRLPKKSPLNKDLVLDRVNHQPKKKPMKVH